MRIRIDDRLTLDDESGLEVGVADDVQINPAEENAVDLYETFREINSIPKERYEGKNVKRGLRNADGTGVIAGLTQVSAVEGYDLVDGKKTPREGSLKFRGHEIKR